MKTPNTHLWNLGASSLAVAAIGLTTAACGPAIGIEGESDGAESESDTIIDPTTDTDPVPVDCEDDGDCGDGEFCFESQCVHEDDPYDPYDCDDYDYGCYCVYGHCSPPTYYDCYGDDDCNSGELCQGNYCDPVQNLPACGDPADAVPIPLPIPTEEAVVSLAFVDIDVDDDEPGEAVVVGAGESGFLLASGAEPVALPPLPSPVRDAVAAQFDGDGTPDLALLHDGGLTILYAFGLPSQRQVDAPATDPPVSLEVYGPAMAPPQLVLRTVANEVLVARGLLDQEPVLEQFDTGGVPVAGIAPYVDNAGTTAFVANAFVNGQSRIYYDEDTFIDVGSFPRTDTVRTIATGSMGAAPGDEVLWATPMGDWTYLELTIDAEVPQTRALYFDYSRYRTGDMDGDGLDDVLALGEGGFAVLPGDADWGFTCFAQGPLLSSAALLLDVGDFDGDGLAEFATLDETGAPVVYDVSWGS